LLLERKISRKVPLIIRSKSVVRNLIFPFVNVLRLIPVRPRVIEEIMEDLSRLVHYLKFSF